MESHLWKYPERGSLEPAEETYGVIQRWAISNQGRKYFGPFSFRNVGVKLWSQSVLEFNMDTASGCQLKKNWLQSVIEAEKGASEVTETCLRGSSLLAHPILMQGFQILIIYFEQVKLAPSLETHIWLSQLPGCCQSAQIAIFNLAVVTCSSLPLIDMFPTITRFCQSGSEESVQSQDNVWCVYSLLLVLGGKTTLYHSHSAVCCPQECLLISVFSLSLLSQSFFLLTHSRNQPSSALLPKTDSFGGQTKDCFQTGSLSLFFLLFSQTW